MLAWYKLGPRLIPHDGREEEQVVWFLPNSASREKKRVWELSFLRHVAFHYGTFQLLIDWLKELIGWRVLSPAPQRYIIRSRLKGWPAWTRAGPPCGNICAKTEEVSSTPWLLPFPVLWGELHVEVNKALLQKADVSLFLKGSNLPYPPTVFAVRSACLQPPICLSLLTVTGPLAFVGLKQWTPSLSRIWARRDTIQGIRQAINSSISNNYSKYIVLLSQVNRVNMINMTQFEIIVCTVLGKAVLNLKTFLLLPWYSTNKPF